ncbi:Ig-like domain-containing protein, partial [Pontibacter sp. HSC-36F09]|uniref:Ig-like domain-containing protein n=1 Tax=Pontibacter sp. HSC-36F09 TaxID=2910966 RepID=UPI0020A1D69C
MHKVGDQGGTAVAFTYDLAKSVIYTRQGNPEWAGQKRDGQAGPIRSDDQFYPDWIDLSKVAIPQADEQQRLLANIITLNSRKPIPRFWYLPRGLKAAVVMTGDDHGNGGTKARFNQYLQLSTDNSAEAVADWRAIRGTSYIYPNTPLTDAEARAFEQQGFEIALHLTTNCENFTPTSLERDLANQLAEFKAHYPSVAAPSTNRTHCIAWSDWHTQPKLEAPKGIRLDANYYYWPSPWVQDRPGMFTGSGIPMRFADLDGGLIDVYQLTTQMTDESDQSFPFTMDQLLNKALGSEGYYGVFCANMHTDASRSDGSDAIIASAKSRNVPVISSKQLLAWLDGRNESSFSSMTWNGGELNFSVNVASGARSLQGMLPMTDATGRLISLTVNGANKPFRVEIIKGIEYAFFESTTGNYVAVYDIDALPNQAPVVNITSPKATDSFTAPASITITANALDSDGTVSLVEFFQGQNKIGEDSNGSDGWSFAWNDVESGDYEITTKATDNLGGTTVSGTVTVKVEAVCPCTVFKPSAAPTGALANDNQALQLGMKFRASVDGFVTGVRFYKQGGNTGTHTGQLYSATGSLLASVVFSNETASGWQEASFASPVFVTAGTTYVISYHTNSGYYSATDNYFTQAVVNGPLTALQNGAVGSNGVYSYTSVPAFPTSSYQASNYWVDAVFNTAATPGNQAPRVSLTSPEDEATFVGPTTVNLTAVASDPDGNIVKVEFYSGAAKLGEDTDDSNGWSYSWENVLAGAYTLTAKAIDNSGATTTSAVVNITVSGPVNTAPTVAISSPTDNASFTVPASVIITASASDSDGSVAKVEFFQGETKLGEDTDGSDGWSLVWNEVTAGAYTLTAKATDDAGGTAISEIVNVRVTAACPCSVFQTSDVPGNNLYDDGQGLQMGMKFRASVDGFVTGVRFYKQGGNTGTHTGQLYSATGSLLASVVFSNETASGWQEASFASPVSVTAGTTYVISYHSSEGKYSATNQFFNLAINRSPLTALANGEDGPNGLYLYSGSPTFPTENNSQSANYWVDVVFHDVPPLGNKPPVVSISTPEDNAIFTAPASVIITASASDSDGNVAKVEIFQGETKIGEDNDGSDGWSLAWNEITAGAYTLTAKATDNAGAIAVSSGINITVNDPVNQLPVVAITSPEEGAAFVAPASVTITASASDADGTVSKVEFYNGEVKLGEVTESPYSYTWNNVGVGTYQLKAVATDNSGASAISSTVSVNVSEPANQLPVVANAIADQSAAVGTAFSFTFGSDVFSDPDGDPLTYTAGLSGGEPLPAWLTFDGATRTFSGTPLSDTQASINLEVSAHDGRGGMVSDVFVLTINLPENQLPIISITSPEAGEAFTAPASVKIVASATDHDGTVAKVEFYNGEIKLGEKSASPYEFTWTNVPAASYQITTVVTDDRGAAVTSSAVNITVTETVNTAPTVTISSPADNTTFTAPASIAISATAADADGTIARVEFLNGETKIGEALTSPYTFTWENVAENSYQLRARAIDDKGLVTTSEPVNITVSAPVNQLPVVRLTAPANNASYTAPATIAIAATATDSDGTISKVEFYSGEDKLGEALASPYSFTWSGVAIGTYQITAVATDNAGAVVISSPVSVVVNPPANMVPVVGIISPKNGAVFTSSSDIPITAEASDTDGTVAKVEFYQGEVSLGEDNDGSDGWSLVWRGATTGDYTLTAKATDNAGAIAVSSGINITVNDPVNQLPVVAITSPEEGAAFVAPASVAITASASDTDGTVSKVEFYNGEVKLGEDLDSPYEFSWNGISVGTYSLTARAIDDKGASTVSGAVQVTVTAPLNNPPVIANAIPDQSAIVGTAFNFTIALNTFSDPDGDPLSYTANLSNGGMLPSWLSFNRGTRTFSGTPPVSALALYSVKVSAADGKGGEISDIFDLSINQPPVGSQQVISFTLVNANNERDVLTIEDGAVISLASLPSSKVNIRANTSPGTVGSVRLELSGTQSRTYTDNKVPYALFGDNGNGNYYYGNW